MEQIQGHLIGKGHKIGIVISRFNEFLTSKLLGGCQDSLIRHGVAEEHISVCWVPGAFEIPLMAKLMAKSKRFNAIICLGAVIRGSTPHFDYVAAEVSKGIASVSFELELPVVFGVLTTDTLEQAIERAGTKHGNKGSEAAMTAIELVNLIHSFCDPKAL
jgi:6,7-dimethyl-8-ribityllumazine synthase